LSIGDATVAKELHAVNKHLQALAVDQKALAVDQKALAVDQKALAVDQKALAVDVGLMQNKFPAGMVTHVLTPSQASAKPGTAKSLFETLQLKQQPLCAESKHYLPPGESALNKWKFSWTWKEAQTQMQSPSDTQVDEKESDDSDDGEAGDTFSKDELEMQSYTPVCEFLEGLGVFAKVVGNGQQLTDGLLYEQDIWTLRQEDPLTHGQHIHLRHVVKGRTDVVVLSEDAGNGPIGRWMVKFAVEVKTVEGMRKSKSGSRSESLVQLIGLNADNPVRSPPVLLTNLASTHSVFYLNLVQPSPVRYVIREQPCDSFASAVHFALSICDRRISTDFSRPATPDRDD
jgi:hypothetical protein